MSSFFKGILILSVLGLMGCSAVRVGGFNPANLDVDQRVADGERMAKKFQELQRNNVVPSNILISDMFLPEGLKLNGDQMVVAQGSKHKVLGYFFVNEAPNLALNNVDAFKLIKQAAGAMGADFVYLALVSENIDKVGHTETYSKTIYYSRAWGVKLDPKVAKKLRAKK